MKKIALPLRQIGRLSIIDAKNRNVVQVFSAGLGIKAAYELQDKIVAAVNAHDELVSALTTALPFVESARYDQGYKPGHCSKIENVIRAALAKAGAA